jgi:hypothetical protein
MTKIDAFIKLLLQAHKRGIKKAIDDSIRTGVPLVAMKNGEIVEIKPKYKYVRVPIKPSKER